MSAFDTGLRLLPLSIGLLTTAVGIPRVWPSAPPRRVVRLGTFSMLVGTGVLVAGLSPGANAAVVSLPLLLIGLGMGALSSQLGAAAVSAVAESEAAEVGGLQNTVTNLGASMGTALVGSILIIVLTASLAHGITENPAIPQRVKDQTAVQMQSGVPFVSDAQLSAELSAAGVHGQAQDEIVKENEQARYDGLRVALSVVLLVGVLGLFLSGGLPMEPVGGEPEPETVADEPPAPAVSGV